MSPAPDCLTHYAYSTGRGKEAMGSTGILPASAGTVVGDALCAYRQYRQSRHALCGAHPLRGLTYVRETCPERRQWTEPLAKLLLEIKAAGGRARPAGRQQLGGERCAQFFRRYDRLAARAARLNPPRPGGRRRPVACSKRKCRSPSGAGARRPHSSSGCGSAGKKCSAL